MRGLWLIDGSYIYKCQRTFQRNNVAFINQGVDYKKLKQEIMRKYGIDQLDGYYFNSTPDPATDEQNQFHSWMKSAEPKGPNIRVKLYGLKKKEISCRNCASPQKMTIQKGVDVGIATTALKLYSKYEVIILSAGDGDFEDFVRYLVEDKDLKMYIVGFSGSISADIQQYSYSIYYLNEHYSEICDGRTPPKPFETADEVAEDEVDTYEVAEDEVI